MNFTLNQEHPRLRHEHTYKQNFTSNQQPYLLRHRDRRRGFIVSRAGGWKRSSLTGLPVALVDRVYGGLSLLVGCWCFYSLSAASSIPLLGCLAFSQMAIQPSDSPDALHLSFPGGDGQPCRPDSPAGSNR